MMVIDNSRFTNVFKTRFKGVLSEFLIVDGNSREIHIENQMNKIKQQQLKQLGNYCILFVLRILQIFWHYINKPTI